MSDPNTEPKNFRELIAAYEKLAVMTQEILVENADLKQLVIAMESGKLSAEDTELLEMIRWGEKSRLLAEKRRGNGAG
jgi:hypothetical protein